MKRFRIFLAVTVLLLASLACQTVLGGGDSGVDSAPPSGGNEPPVLPQTGGSDSLESEFPIPSGAKNMTEIGGTLNFQVKMSIKEATDFYLTELSAMGYTERPILTVIEESTFSMVFDGHASGKPIVVQGVDLGDGTTNINIRLEDF